MLKGLLAIDNTWTFGPFYLDICGRVDWRDMEIGLAFQLNRGYFPWGRSLTLRLLFWAVSIGINA